MGGADPPPAIAGLAPHDDEQGLHGEADDGQQRCPGKRQVVRLRHFGQVSTHGREPAGARPREVAPTLTDRAHPPADIGDPDDQRSGRRRAADQVASDGGRRFPWTVPDAGPRDERRLARQSDGNQPADRGARAGTFRCPHGRDDEHRRRQISQRETHATKRSSRKKDARPREQAAGTVDRQQAP